jgi:hypothetical protein
MQWMAYPNRVDPARLVFIDETWTKTKLFFLPKYLKLLRQSRI